MVDTSFETQYVNSLKNILINGIECENRTGVNTLSVQHQYFNLKEITRNFPIIRGKKVFPKLALKEVMWMMNGLTDVKWLNDRGLNYWNEWQGPDGTIGKSYGYQFRNFNGTDNLKTLLYQMAENPTSRRLQMTLWNVNDLSEMRLPPCVYDYHFCCVPSHSKVVGKQIFYVDLHTTSRSEDSFLGQPYDFMWSAWFLLIMCHLAELMSKDKYVFIPTDIHYTAHDYHMYKNHIEQVKTYLRNVEENKNDVISGTDMPNIMRMQFDSNDGIYARDEILDAYLKQADKTKYLDFYMNKDYDDIYPRIDAPIAI